MSDMDALGVTTRTDRPSSQQLLRIMSVTTRQPGARFPIADLQKTSQLRAFLYRLAPAEKCVVPTLVGGVGKGSGEEVRRVQTQLASTASCDNHSLTIEHFWGTQPLTALQVYFYLPDKPSRSGRTAWGLTKLPS